MALHKVRSHRQFNIELAEELLRASDRSRKRKRMDSGSSSSSSSTEMRLVAREEGKRKSGGVITRAVMDGRRFIALHRMERCPRMNPPLHVCTAFVRVA